MRHLSRSLLASLLALATACTEETDPTATSQAALEEDDALFVNPGAAQYGDFVIPSNPTLTITRLSQTPTTVAVFTRDPSAPADTRIKAVLQDDVDDSDFDLNPVGYFQATWPTTASQAGSWFRATVTLPNGKIVTSVDVYLAAAKKDLKNVDLAGGFGRVAGKAIKLRFRVDAGAVDQDGDGILDWGDTCPGVSNPSQADISCPPEHVFDSATCACACSPCDAGHVLLDEETCACGCDPGIDWSCAGYPAGFVFDPTECKCECPDLICPPNHVADTSSCSCVCADAGCIAPQVQDPESCLCACPQLLEDQLLDPCESSPAGFVFDPIKCVCACPVLDISCPAGTVLDPDKCECLPNYAMCGPGQVLDLETLTCQCANLGQIQCAPNQVFSPVTCTCN
jgi:hypothetical protein